MSVFTIILILALVVVEWIAIAGYNKFRGRLDGKMGVPGAFACFVCVFILVEFICTLVTGSKFNMGTTIWLLIFALAGAGYTAYIMLTKCRTTKERVMLPVNAVLTAMGFVFRFLLSLILGISYYSGEQANTKEAIRSRQAESGIYPVEVTDNSGVTWKLKRQDTRIIYESDDGQTVEL